MDIAFAFEIFKFGASQLTNLKYKERSRLRFEPYLQQAQDAYTNVCLFLEEKGLKKKNFLVRTRDNYIQSVLEKTLKRGDFYYYYEGEIESMFLDAFNLPTDQRINVFYKYVFLLQLGSENLLRNLHFTENIRRLSTKSKTVFHYLSIPGWVGLKHNKLLEEVKKILQPDKFERGKIAYGVVHQRDEKPKIYKTIEIALKQGKISEKTIFNLSSSQKLLLVLKYSEGIGAVYTHQKSQLDALNAKIKELELDGQTDTAEEVKSMKEKRKQIKDEFARAPLTVIFEKHGFQKVFRNMDGVYVIPLSLLPSEYQRKPESFISNVIIDEASAERQSIASRFKGIVEVDVSPKYIVLAATLPLSELRVFTRERELSVSSPVLYKVLFTEYLLGSKSAISDVYLNDVVRNVDFISLLGNSQTAEFVKKNFDKLKDILWNDFEINLLRPMTLASLSKEHAREISKKLVGKKKKPGVGTVSKMLSEKFEFYRELSQEIDSI
ncbi:MAG: hypothetical protein KIS85_07740 [Anaerolineales bacterium]|nr:hypothetical protein [Anaerolineales bacterium]